MSVTDWSPQPSGNAMADPAIPARDGMAVRDISRSVRGLMAKAAALALDQGGALISTGTDNAYEVATNSGFTEIKPGVSLSFWADRDNTGAPTLNVDGSGPRRWLSADGLALPAGAIQGGLFYTVTWNAALAGSLPAWRLTGAVTGSTSTGLAGFDFSGTLAERTQYDAQPKDKVYLAIAETPGGTSWTLYVKRSNGFGDWSAGLPIKASPAQSTVDAQSAANLADQQRAAATEQASLASQQAQAATGQAGISTVQAGVATARATDAAVSAAEARSAALLVGALNYDMGSLGEAVGGSIEFDFGVL